MSTKTAHFCDAQDCGRHIADPLPPACLVCAKEFCDAHRTTKRTFTWAFTSSNSSYAEFLPLCSECTQAHADVLAHTFQEAMLLLQPVVLKALENLKLAHTSKALSE